MKTNGELGFVITAKGDTITGMKQRILDGAYIGATLLVAILLFTIADHAVHGIQDTWAVPDYYFRNKIPFGLLWAVVGYALSLRFRTVLARALVVAGVVSVTLQTRYFLEGYPSDFVFLFLLIHFAILLVLFTGVFAVFRSVNSTSIKSMKKLLISLLVLAVVGGAAYVFVFKSPGPGNGYASPTPRVSMSSTPVATTAPTPIPVPSGASINISNFAFTPATLSVKVGTTVTWTNNDSAPHTITSDVGSALKSPTLSTGQSYQVTLTSLGTVSYHCSIHPSMKGAIVVTK